MFFDDEFDLAFQRMMRPFAGILEGADAGQKPYYYGYRVTIGPDGRPVVSEYGNLRRLNTPEQGTAQPLVDTILNEKEGVIKLVAELPGIDKHEINVVVDGSVVSIDAEHGERKYHTKIPLKQKVQNDSATASYKNGILEIVLRLATPEKPKGRSVEVN